MKLNRKQKLAMMLSLSDVGRSVFPDREQRPPQWERARTCMDWLRHQLEAAEAHGMSVAAPEVEDGAFFLDVAEEEVADALCTVMEAVMEAEEPDDGAPDRPHA